MTHFRLTGRIHPSEASLDRLVDEIGGPALLPVGVSASRA